MNMKTPLKTVRGLGSAKSGTEHFWQQRVTGLFNLPLMLFLVWFVVSHLGATRADMLATLQNRYIVVLLLLTLASVFWHMRLGLQVVIEDYVHGHFAKFAALMLNNLVPLVAFGIAAISILKMSFAN